MNPENSPTPSDPSSRPNDHLDRSCADERLAGAEPNIPVEPAAGAAPQAVAGELFTHGLLTYLHADTPAAQVERVRRVMAAVDADRAAPAPRPMRSSRRFAGFPVRSSRGWLALAASLALAGGAVYLGFPGETSAQAVVQQSIEAMRASGDRRYEIRLQPRTQDTMPSLPGAIIDTRSPNLLLLRANAPDGHEIIAGRDATGDWAVRRDGGIERQHPEVAWPRWAKVGDETLFVDSVDKLLEELTKSYDLQREGEAKIDGKGDTVYRHIVGAKKRIRCPGGDHVEVWIDRATNVVQRLEMRWDGPPAQADGPQDAGDRDNPPGAGAAPKDLAPEGARRPRPPRGPQPRNGPGPDGPGPDGPGPDGPDGGPRPDGPPDGPPPGMDGGPGGGPRPDGDHRRPPPPPRPGDRPERGDRPDGPGPRGPGPGAGEHRGPPRALVMERVDAPAFDAGWFSPEAHVTK